jgi:hypothetical protein
LGISVAVDDVEAAADVGVLGAARAAEQVAFGQQAGEICGEGESSEV